ncbi:MAG: hypothetical protein M1824_006490 [Vezdaea acicularis]|nr:MAG: hypothetical protein M1824_006490 [Vezdaea acicularis]
MATQAGAAKNCFLPNGALRGDDSPCDPNAEDSPCCWQSLGYECLDNGLCVGNGTANVSPQIIRGTCTDPTWKSPKCPQYCLENDYTGAGAANFTIDTVVWQCSSGDPANGGSFCCDIAYPSPNNQSCCGQYNMFSLGSTVGSQSTSSAKSGTTSTASSRATSTAATTTATAATTSNLASSGSSNHAAAIGAGVGVPVGVLALAGIGFLLFRRRKNRKSAAPPQAIHSEASTWHKSELPADEAAQVPLKDPNLEHEDQNVYEMAGH